MYSHIVTYYSSNFDCVIDNNLHNACDYNGEQSASL